MHRNFVHRCSMIRHDTAEAHQLEQQLARVDRLSKLLDSQFTIPGTKIKLGYDAILGLIPVVGDTVSMTISFYIIYIARQCGLKKRVIAKMLGNIMKDYLIGLVPLVGDYLDIASRANLKNAKLLADNLEQKVNKAALA